ncbi:N-acetyllactosaminide beta-1,3-N-acetylglucosaminyltransferase 2 [Syngnathus scovelli]|uniref:N-acetyllactosaminide beta-1,3-N-acetylglucosaminyltransferase 2 n=1 Tax=Syngnathus scovelli TaxID=161590 RepID=UPI00210F6FA0|nr:N-acetyllactosaminide beta-1,3-N-acetylglucosaminyltransferase 2 [Syngnathus scovelli]
MARCHYRRALICVCSPCIFLLVLFLFLGIMVCSNMNKTTRSIHFVASGSFKNKNFASMPKTFWKLHEEAFWNQLQLTLDRQFNPILNPQNAYMRFRSHAFYVSLMSRSFSEVTDLDPVRRKMEQLPLQMQDFVSHMKRRSYPVLIQPADMTCGAGAVDEKEPPLLLLAIKSTALNFENRQAIRQTWGQAGWVATRGMDGRPRQKVGGYIRRVFLLGKEYPRDSEWDISELLQEEGEQYGDILQWDFNDTFFNLTLKDVLFWNWFSRQCSKTRFVFKGDDDVFVNTVNMITYLHNQLEKPNAEHIMNEFMVGDVISAAFPNRVHQSKYFVPDSFYKGLYPTYAGGGGVVYSGQLAKRLHNISGRVHLFPIDVFVGMCMARLNAHPIHHSGFLTFDFPYNEDKEPCAYHTILLVHKRSPKQLIELWDKLSKSKNQCRFVSLRVSNKRKNTRIN